MFLKHCLDCFNTYDGVGLFAGPGRYSVLAGRVEICAVQADSLPRFWALLLRRMSWPVPPKAADARLAELLNDTDPGATLRVLATETASCLSIARMVHSEDKATRKTYTETPEEA